MVEEEKVALVEQTCDDLLEIVKTFPADFSARSLTFILVVYLMAVRRSPFDPEFLISALNEVLEKLGFPKEYLEKFYAGTATENREGG